MRVGAERQAEMPGVFRTVIGLRLRAQYCLHHLCLFALVGHILQHAVEQAGGDDLPQRKIAPEGGEIFLQRDQLLAAWRFVDAIDHGRGLVFQCLCRRDIGGDHEILDHPMRVEPFANGDFGNLALIVEHDPPFGQFEFERIALVACGGEHFPACPQVLQPFVRLARIDPCLRVLVSDIRRNPHNGSAELLFEHLTLRIDMQMAHHRRAILALLERADIGTQHFGQHGHDAVGEIDRIAAFARLAVKRAGWADVKRYIGDCDHRLEAALPVRFGPDRIVMVARIGGVDGDNGQVAEVFALVCAQRQLRRELRFLKCCLGEDMRNAVLGDCNQRKRLGRERIAQNLDHLHARAG